MRARSVLLSGLLCVGIVVLLPSGAATASRTIASKKGGTLRVDLRSDFDFLDPALAYYAQSWEVEYATAMKLLDFPDKEAARGGTRLIPEAAASMPVVSKDRKSYTFTIRKGLRFSNGKPITAKDFKYTFNRLADPKMNSPATTFMEDIVGEQAANKSGGNISGIKVKGNKLIFRMTKVAPDFLARMTMPFFSAVPLGTPHNPEGVIPPSGGPYYVASWDKGRQAVLNVNKFYKGTRPHNVDTIQYNIGITLDAQRLRAERGDTDVAGLPPAAAAELRDKYGVNTGRFFVKGQGVMWYLSMNHDQPLFKDNDQLAEAVNFALDRPAMVREHGALGGAAADMILPIGFPGFREWSLYQLNGPDVAKAKELAAGHTRSGIVRLWTFNRPSFGPSVAQVVKDDLAQIGLNVEITTFANLPLMLGKAGTRGAAFDMLLNGWGADYPDPFDFINVLLNGTSLGPANNGNFSYFNDPTYNARMDAANKQFGARRLNAYSILDRDLMQGPAPIAPYINTNTRILVSSRVGCFTFQQVYGTDYAALCLK
jgi:ABC-type transport system substrate-binding protein